MFNRKIVDEIKVKRIWWLSPEQRPFVRKNRKKCSCWICGNQRNKSNGKNNHTIKEQSLNFLHQDEIDEFLVSLEVTDEDIWYGD